MTDWIEGFAEANPWPTALVGVLLGLAALALLVVAAKAGVKAFRTRRYAQGRLTVAQIVSTIGALIATGVGANTAWRFAGEHLHITDVVERGSLFLAGEVMLFGLALMARQNLHNKEMGRAGLPGVLVWVLSAFLAVPAISESDSVAGAAWRIVLGPLGAALLWHLAMGIELRQAEENRENNGIGARILRRFQQQLLARLGIAEHDKDAQELIEERARSRAAELADEYRALDEKKLNGRKGRKLRAKMRTTLREAGVATNPERKRLLLADLAVSSHAPALVNLEFESPWVDVPELTAAPVATAPELSVEERMYAAFRAYVAEHGALPVGPLQLEAGGDPLPASQGDLDEEWKRITDAVKADDQDGPDDDGGPEGPGGGAPLPEQQAGDAEAVLNATVWEQQEQDVEPQPEAEPVLSQEEIDRARHIKALKSEELETNADAIRYAIRETGTTVAGQLVRWLAQHGREGVNEGQAYRVAKKQVEEQRRSNVRPLRPTPGV
ncbi:hypothetical protein [Streptomyces sp. CT34]|uniref:hypothetical protein n=1 Tax=Streptomyces sp. CT34 TaxID=1553907 RepID=UPI000A44BB30|nr:hypothetical protein [Streptomyces sp. CT34]